MREKSKIIDEEKYIIPLYDHGAVALPILNGYTLRFFDRMTLAMEAFDHLAMAQN